MIMSPLFTFCPGSTSISRTMPDTSARISRLSDRVTEPVPVTVTDSELRRATAVAYEG